MKLYFIRHGKTEWNLEMRFQGASGDSPLLETSIDELKRLGKHLSNVQFDKIYSSDLPLALAILQRLSKVKTSIKLTLFRLLN